MESFGKVLTGNFFKPQTREPIGNSGGEGISLQEALRFHFVQNELK